MTANELLALLGRAWSRLLLYPGGLAAFGLVWLIALIPKPASSAKRQEPIRLEGSEFLILSAVAMPWLALALLPLPLAVALPRQIDIIVALVLLEWPQLLAIGQRLRAGDTRRLAAALNGYPPLILATLALAQPAGSLEVAALARLPGDLASESVKALHWLGALALALALPPALGIGPFADEPRPTTDTRQINHKRLERRSSLRGWVSIRHSVAGAFAAGAIEIGLRLRGLGLVALAALPWSGSQDDSSWALLRMLAAAILIAALLWGYDRLAREQPARRWARAYLAFDATLLLALMWAAYQALQARLG